MLSPALGASRSATVGLCANSPTNLADPEPLWLTRVAIDLLHHDQLVEHGGLSGIRDENAIEAALARPRNRWMYETTRDVAELAAAYCHGFARGHPYVDGNKRTGFLAMAAFLDMNGLELTATDEGVVDLVRGVAAGSVSETELVAWIRANVRRTFAGERPASDAI